MFSCQFLRGTYLFKVNNENTKTTCEISLNLTIKTPERDVITSLLSFNINFEQISHTAVVFLFLTLNKHMPVGLWEIFRTLEEHLGKETREIIHLIWSILPFFYWLPVVIYFALIFVVLLFSSISPWFVLLFLLFLFLLKHILFQNYFSFSGHS